MESSTRITFPTHMLVWKAIHDAIPRDAERLTRCLALSRPPLDRDAARALAGWFERFESTIHLHHVIEDEVFWPALRERRPEFAAAEPDMLAEHEELDAAIARLRGAIAAVAAGPDSDDARREAQAAVTAFDAVVRHHIDHEERVAVRYIGELFSAEEFKTIDQGAIAMMSMDDIAFLAPWCLDGKTREDVATVLATVPRMFGVMWRLVWRRRYDRLAAPLRSLATA